MELSFKESEVTIEIQDLQDNEQIFSGEYYFSE